MKAIITSLAKEIQVREIRVFEDEVAFGGPYVWSAILKIYPHDPNDPTSDIPEVALQCNLDLDGNTQVSLKRLVECRRALRIAIKEAGFVKWKRRMGDGSVEINDV